MFKQKPGADHVVSYHGKCLKDSSIVYCSRTLFIIFIMLPSDYNFYPFYSHFEKWDDVEKISEHPGNFPTKWSWCLRASVKFCNDRRRSFNEAHNLLLCALILKPSLFFVKLWKFCSKLKILKTLKDTKMFDTKRRSNQSLLVKNSLQSMWRNMWFLHLQPVKSAFMNMCSKGLRQLWNAEQHNFTTASKNQNRELHK